MCGCRMHVQMVAHSRWLLYGHSCSASLGCLQTHDPSFRMKLLASFSWTINSFNLKLPQVGLASRVAPSSKQLIQTCPAVIQRYES